MELAVPALRQEEQQVQAGDLVALGDVGGDDVAGQLVEGRELRDVAGEGVGVAGADGHEGALLVRLAGEGQQGRVRRGRGRQGVELEQQELGFREQGGRLVIAERGGLDLELGEDLGELSIRHGSGFADRLRGGR